MFFNQVSWERLQFLFSLITAAVSLLLLGSSPSHVKITHPSSSNRKLSGEFLIKVKSGSDLLSFAQFAGLLVIPQPLLTTPTGLWFKIVDPSGTFDAEKLMSLGLDSGIIYAEQNFLWHAISSFRRVGDIVREVNPQPSNPPTLPRRPLADPQLGKVWGLSKISAPQAWNITRGDVQVVVANIDSGIDYNHEDLINNIWRNPGEIAGDNQDNDGNGFVDDVVGWDFYNRDNRPWDDNGHGTHTSGTIGATGGNGIGFSGVAARVSLLPIKFLSRSGTGTTEDAIRSINYAVQVGAHILSNSWGGDEYSEALKDAIMVAANKNVLFVAAAGNDGTDNDSTPMYPASYDLPNVVSVAASDRDDQLADFSNFGINSVHLAAPGDVVHSTLPANRYGIMSGTSMACPAAAGAAALLKAYNPGLNASAIREILMSSVDRAPSFEGKVRSGGRLNIERALLKAAENIAN